MIDLYQMASLAGIFGSWRTDGEMLQCFVFFFVFSRPLSSPSRKEEGLLNAERAGGEAVAASEWGCGTGGKR